MIYTVSEMAKLLDVAPSTLRYYDKEGLLPFVERSEGGMRVFTEKDYQWMQIITCLKKAGMQIKDIKRYIQMAMEGDETIEERLSMFQEQRQRILEQINQLQQTLEVVDYKCWYYETAKAAGTADVPAQMTEAEIPERFCEVRRRLRGDHEE